ncbi:MAG: hypothetical protein ABI461_10970 [Polyangiaceae bacterium]
MHGRRSTITVLVAAFWVATFSVRAHASDSCRAMEVTLSSDLDETWSSAARDLRKQLPASAPGECIAMTLSVRPDGNGAALLVATARDGRHAERRVDKPSALGAIALGLVASLPPDDITEAEVSAADAEKKSAAVKPAPPTSAIVASPPPSPAPASTALPKADDPAQFWLGGDLGARAAAPTAVGMLDLEARGDLVVKRWFLTASLRYGTSIGETLTRRDASYDETAIGIGVGREIPIGKTALQIALAPSIVSVNIDDADDANGTNGSRSGLRVGASIRWSVPLDEWWRFTVTADSDLSPRSLTHYVYLDSDLPPLPFWTGGLRLGAAGKLL